MAALTLFPSRDFCLGVQEVDYTDTQVLATHCYDELTG